MESLGFYAIMENVAFVGIYWWHVMVARPRLLANNSLLALKQPAILQPRAHQIIARKASKKLTWK